MYELSFRSGFFRVNSPDSAFDLWDPDDIADDDALSDNEGPISDGEDDIVDDPAYTPEDSSESSSVGEEESSEDDHGELLPLSR